MHACRLVGRTALIMLLLQVHFMVWSSVACALDGYSSPTSSIGRVSKKLKPSTTSEQQTGARREPNTFPSTGRKLSSNSMSMLLDQRRSVPCGYLQEGGGLMPGGFSGVRRGNRCFISAGSRIGSRGQHVSRTLGQHVATAHSSHGYHRSGRFP